MPKYIVFDRERKNAKGESHWFRKVKRYHPGFFIAQTKTEMPHTIVQDNLEKLLVDGLRVVKLITARTMAEAQAFAKRL